MSAEAKRCDGCHRMTYGVERVALLVAMQLRAERDLCAACRTNALDGFLQAQDGLVIHKAIVR